jgi:hypothetical protein
VTIHVRSIDPFGTLSIQNSPVNVKTLSLQMARRGWASGALVNAKNQHPARFKPSRRAIRAIVNGVNCAPNKPFCF